MERLKSRFNRTLAFLALIGSTHTTFGGDVDPVRGIPLDVMVHVGDTGDLWHREQEVAGKPYVPKEIQAIAIRCRDHPEIQIRARGHQANHGDIPWVTFDSPDAILGSRGEGLALQGIALEIVGPAADKYDIFYRVYVRDMGWLPASSNGHFAGTRGLAKSIDGLSVIIKPK